jgi:hypothetical protein
MSNRKFNGPLFALLGAGDTITGAALDTANAPRLNLRLKPPYVSDTVALILDIRAKMEARAGKQGDLATLTVAEQKLIKAVLDQMSKARETAKRAFKANPVKLHDEFRVGQSDKSAGGILGNARIVSASLKKTENTAPLADKGWLDADTQKLDDAITAAAAGLQPRQPGQSDEIGQTAFLISEANDLYDRLQDIQNAVDLEWPADDPTNVAVRAKFLLGVFPYGSTSSGTTPPPTPTPAPAAPAK